MAFVGWFLIGGGIFMIYCAYLGISPISEVKSVITGTAKPAAHSFTGSVKQ